MRTVQNVHFLKNKVSVIIDDQTLFLHPDLVVLYQIRKDKSLDEANYQKLMAENEHLMAKAFAIRKLAKMQSSQTLFNRMIQEGFELTIVKRVLDEMKEKRYLDDRVFARTYVEQKKHKQGPRLIEDALTRMGVDSRDIDEALSTVHEDDVIEQRIHTFFKKTNHLTQKQAMIKIRTKLLGLGYAEEHIDKTIHRLSYLIEVDENETIQKPFQQVKAHYQKKYEGYPLKAKIQTKLYEKGFSKDAILRVIERNLKS